MITSSMINNRPVPILWGSLQASQAYSQSNWHHLCVLARRYVHIIMQTLSISRHQICCQYSRKISQSFRSIPFPLQQLRWEVLASAEHLSQMTKLSTSTSSGQFVSNGSSALEAAESSLPVTRLPSMRLQLQPRLQWTFCSFRCTWEPSNVSWQ